MPTSKKILSVHWDGAGNVPPQRALARELVRRGHDVHVMSHATLRQAVEADGCTFHPLSSCPEFDAAAPRPPSEELALLSDHVWSSDRFAADFSDLWDALEPDLCIIDSMLVSTMATASLRNIPFAAVHHLAWDPDSLVSQLLNGFGGRHYRSDVARPYFDLLRQADPILATSYRAFGSTAEGVPEPIFVGPIREEARGAEDERPGSGRPLVLVGLSTMFQDQGATLRNVAAALSTVPVDAIITTGRGYSPEEVPAGDNVRVVRHRPHDEVLPHADLTITHGGLGTAMFSAGHGVPMLVLPNGRDQDDNAAVVERLGLGRTISASSGPEEIAQAVEAALCDPALRANAAAFARKVHAFGELHRAADVIEEAANRAPR